jgi:hypothetical protein
MREREYFRYDDKTASRLAPNSDDGRFDLYVAMNWRNDWHNPEFSERTAPKSTIPKSPSRLRSGEWHADYQRDEFEAGIHQRRDESEIKRS